MFRFAQELLGTVLLFIQPRMITVAMLGVTAGLPLALTGSVLTAWMTEAGVSLGSIGLIALVGLSYNFKFLWAPVIDSTALAAADHLAGTAAWLVDFLPIGADGRGRRPGRGGPIQYPAGHRRTGGFGGLPVGLSGYCH